MKAKLFVWTLFLISRVSAFAQSEFDLYGLWKPINFILTVTSDASDKGQLRKKCMLNQVKISKNKIEVLPKGACLLDKLTHFKI